MSGSADPDFLRQNQYRDSSNLQARMELHQGYSTSVEPFWRWAFPFLDLGGSAQILEVGCGVGGFWGANSDRIPDGWHVVLTDLSPGMVEAAREALHVVAHPFDYRVADVRNLPFENASFDAVVANFMLYHLPDRRQALAEIARVLKPYGLLFASTNGSAHLREIRELEQRFRLETLFGATSSAQAFGLQNGTAQLEPFFTQIACHRHEDRLVVPKADPIVRHIRSKLIDPAAAGRKLDMVRAHVERTILERGQFTVTKASGVFTARKR